MAAGSRQVTGARLDAHVVVRRAGFALDAAIAVAPGETLAVMGPSGAGKSTLLRAIAGLERPAAGRIRVDDRVLDDAACSRAHVPPERRGVVLLGQEPRLFPHLTAAQNVAFALRVHGVAGADARDEARAWLDRVGLAGHADRRPSTLSGGQQHRVALARALAARPRVLLLDEPSTSLDVETAADVRTAVAEQLADTGTTTVVVTHDVVDAVALADRLTILEGGRVTQQDAVRTVLDAPATRTAAAIAGRNRLDGSMDADGWACMHGTLRLPPLAAASTAARGAVAAVFAPAAVTLVAGRPPASSGGVRPAWQARVRRIEATPGGARVVTTSTTCACTVAADLPLDDVARQRVAPSAHVVVQVDADAVRLVP